MFSDAKDLSLSACLQEPADIDRRKQVVLRLLRFACCRSGSPRFVQRLRRIRGRGIGGRARPIGMTAVEDSYPQADQVARRIRSSGICPIRRPSPVLRVSNKRQCKNSCEDRTRQIGAVCRSSGYACNNRRLLGHSTRNRPEVSHEGCEGRLPAIELRQRPNAGPWSRADRCRIRPPRPAPTELLHG